MQLNYVKFKLNLCIKSSQKRKRSSEKAEAALLGDQKEKFIQLKFKYWL